jgi:uncharacterized RDD family membrane protein YckC
MRRILAYAIDGTTATLLFGCAASLSSPVLNILDSASVGIGLTLILLVGLFPAFREDATPGLFVVGLRIVSLRGGSPNVYQLLLRAAIAVFLFSSLYVLLEFIFSYFLQLNLGNAVGWLASAVWLILALPTFILTRGRFAFHDCVAGTYVVSRSSTTASPLKAPAYLRGLVLAAISVVALAAIGAKSYWPRVVDSATQTSLPSAMREFEDAARAHVDIETGDLLDGLNEPFKYYADLHGFHGFRSLDNYRDELARRGLQDVQAREDVAPTYSILLTTTGQISTNAQDAIVRNLLTWIGKNGRRACIVEFVSRTDVLGLLTFRVVRRVLAVEIDRTPPLRSVVVTVPAKAIGLSIVSSSFSEELIRMTGGDRD